MELVISVNHWLLLGYIPVGYSEGKSLERFRKVVTANIAAIYRNRNIDVTVHTNGACDNVEVTLMSDNGDTPTLGMANTVQMVTHNTVSRLDWLRKPGAALDEADPLPKFDWMYLERLDFTGCDLSGLTFRYAKLNGAILTGADLTKTDFTGANLTKADLTGATLDKTQMNYCIGYNGGC